MRISCIQHVAFEGPAAILDWSHKRGHDFSLVRVDLGAALPTLDTFDWLVVMGGPMGVSDADRYPWMRQEIHLISEAVQAGKRVLGICLGAQMLAHALGAKVYPAPHREIGWFEVEGVPCVCSGQCDVLQGRFTPLHWHGDTFDLPAGAVHLARSKGCENQAFQFGPRAIGLQFHLEATPESVAKMLIHCGHEIGTGRWESKVEAIQDCELQCSFIRPTLDAVLLFLERTSE